MAASSSISTEMAQPWFLKSTFPVDFPEHEAFTASPNDHASFVRSDITAYRQQQRQLLLHKDDSAEIKAVEDNMSDTTMDQESFTLTAGTTSTDIRQHLSTMDIASMDSASSEHSVEEAVTANHPFMKGLLEHGKPQSLPNLENKMLTENLDVAYASSNNALVDLFYEMEELVSGPRLRETLEASWKEDPLKTLKIIFNARSIHLGKSSRLVFYRAAGWLAENHPITLISNLHWLVRPVIDKKARKRGEGKDDPDDDIVVVQSENDMNDPLAHNVQHGLAHGYWKDLLNVLVLAANQQFTVFSDPRELLNPGDSTSKKQEKGTKRSLRKMHREIRNKKFQAQTNVAGKPLRQKQDEDGSTGKLDEETETDMIDEKPHAEESEGKQLQGPTDWKALKHERRDARHENAVSQFEQNAIYRCLHIVVARLFADQLSLDLKALRGTDAKAKREISLAGKWAPSATLFHDSHTWIVSSIAEIMHPRGNLDRVPPSDDRSVYLKYAREEYRKDISALRKHLGVVERDVSAGTFQSIHYDRLPSLAMRLHTKTFIQKDQTRFEKYLDNVAAGKAKISGATLLPSQCVSAIKSLANRRAEWQLDDNAEKMPVKQLIQMKEKEIERKMMDGMWKSLVQRVKDTGTLSSSIAVCDVSGSMGGPLLSDKTCPMDSAIGLSLLIAEVTEPPFGAAFITFSSKPAVVPVDITQTLYEKVNNITTSNAGFSTDFVAVFEKLILPMAIKNQVKPDDMVKRVFVFSDMHFNSAEINSSDRWTSSYERIKAKYSEAGYEMPEMIFWNLAGGGRHNTAPKPVDANTPGTALVSGYSQGMLKALLATGGFDDEVEEDTLEDDALMSADGEVEIVKNEKNSQGIDPTKLMNQAIGHKAYDMLHIMD